MQVNGWGLHQFHLFEEILRDLIRDVQALQTADPVGYVHHQKSKFLKRVRIAIGQTVPADPNHKNFRLGGTLGDRHKSWRRVKGGLPDRYRLFFQFSSTDKSIVYAWLNDSTCLRQDGAKTDVYRVFKWMISNGKVANNYAELKAAANELKFKPGKE